MSSNQSNSQTSLENCQRCGDAPHPGWKCEVPSDSGEFVSNHISNSLGDQNSQYPIYKSLEWATWFISQFTPEEFNLEFSSKYTRQQWIDWFATQYTIEEWEEWYYLEEEEDEEEEECLGWCGGGWCKCNIKRPPLIV